MTPMLRRSARSAWFLALVAALFLWHLSLLG